jgi:hypothetical protein
MKSDFNVGITDSDADRILDLISCAGLQLITNKVTK